MAVSCMDGVGKSDWTWGLMAKIVNDRTGYSLYSKASIAIVISRAQLRMARCMMQG
jgi:hypothetical protein